MSTILLRKGADYSLNSRKFIPPVANGLQGWWYLGGMSGDDTNTALARTVKNLAGTSYGMTPVGGPTISTGFVTVDSTHHLDTTIPETLDFTIIILGQGLAINAQANVWRVGAGVTCGMAFSSPATSITSFSGKDNGSGVVQSVAAGSMVIGAGFTAMRMLSFKISAAGTSNLRDLTGGTITATANVAPRMLVDQTTANTLRLGGNNQYGGQAKFGFLAHYNRVLSDAEIDQVKAFVANYRLKKYGDIV